MENNWSDSRFRNRKEANDRLKRENKKRRREQVRIFGVLGSIGGHVWNRRKRKEETPSVPTFIAGCWMKYVKLEKIGESQRVSEMLYGFHGGIF